MFSNLPATSAGSTLLPEPSALVQTIPAHFLAGLLTGRFQMEDWPRNPVTDKKIVPKGDDITTALAFALNYDHHFCYIRSSDTIYIRVPETFLYIRCPDERLMELVTQRWTPALAVLGAPNPKKIKDTVEMVKNYAKERMDTISRQYISVSPNLYWDTETATLTDAPTQPVFFRLFDSDEETLHIRKVPPFTDTQLSTLKSEFKRILQYQENHDGDLPEDFEFVQLWANFSHDLYCDIMKASANVFMRKKTMGAFMPIGLRRNGKTAWSNDFMKTMLGTNNCSNVQMANLGNPHQTNQLQWTLYNAPDEEREIPTKYIEEFKTICDHGHLSMDKFFSQDTIPLNCDFVCVCPMNSEPQWAAQGMAPLVARSFVMPFTHDFKAEDVNPIPFPERTFTAEMFSRMLGHLFAIAAYYRTRNLHFSEVVMSYQCTLDEETSSHITYFNHFIVFFDGFQSIKQLYEDYKIWCKSNAHDCVPVSQGTFKLAFAEFMKGRERTRTSVNGVKSKVYRIPRSGYKPLIDEAKYHGMKRYIGRPIDLHNSEPALSIIERMEADMEEAYKDDYAQELERQIASAKKFIDGQKEVSPPPTEPTQPTLGVDDGIFN